MLGIGRGTQLLKIDKNEPVWQVSKANLSQTDFFCIFTVYLAILVNLDTLFHFNSVLNCTQLKIELKNQMKGKSCK